MGTSGWRYRHWRDVLYPKGVPESRWLEHFQSEFATVELNSTFYGLPSQDTVRAWVARVRPEFIFAVKGSRYVTHVLRLRNTVEALDRLLDRVRPLGPNLGPLLWQLPPDLECDLRTLESFLDRLPADLHYAFEFRHRSWLSPPVRDLLGERGASFCLADGGPMSVSRPLAEGFVYVRLHGPTATYSSPYSDDELARWARRIRRWEHQGRDVYVYFNNDLGGHAVRNARRLLGLLMFEGPASAPSARDRRSLQPARRLARTR